MAAPGLPASSDPPDAPPAGELESALAKHARRFEPWALYRLVQRLFPGRPIHLRGRSSAAPQPSAVDSIGFGPAGVTITLNLGLRSATSALPSYFRELEADPLLGPPLFTLIEHIDAALLRDRLEALDPGSSGWLAPAGRYLGERLRQISRLATPSGLYWLFSRAFPEFQVSVRRGMFTERLAAMAAELGRAALGSAMLGGTVRSPTWGFDVVLLKTSNDTWTENDWPVEVMRRLENTVWRGLDPTEALLRVWLVDPDGRAALRLGDGRVGVEPLVVASRPEVRLIFEGRAPRSRGD